MYPNIASLVVSLPLNFLEISNDGKGGRNILGLAPTWIVLNRSGKGIEVGPSSHRKVRYATSCL